MRDALRCRDRRRPGAFFAEHGTSCSIGSPPTRSSTGSAPRTTTFAAQRRTGFPDAVFDVARPYGSLDEPDLGQLLFPERRVAGVHDTLMWRNSMRVAAAPARPARGGRRELGPPDLQATGARPRDPVAPGRGVLGAEPRRTTPSARGCRSTTSTSTTGACGSCPVHTAAGCCRIVTSVTTPRCTSSSSSTRSTRRPRYRSRCARAP